jgi:hypothetical protein
MNQPSRSNGLWIFALGVGALSLVVVVAVGILIFRGGSGTNAGPIPSVNEGQFEKAVRAAAALENIRYDEAETLYAELRQTYPKEPAYIRNAAIAALANVKYHIDLAQDSKNDVEAIRARLPILFERSENAIRSYRDLRPDDPVAYQLDVLRDSRWISVLAAANPIIADEEQAKLFAKLREYVVQFPTNAFLVTQFNNSAEVMSGVDPQALDQTIEPLRKVQQANPRNIYLLCLLIQRLVQARDPAALDLVEPLAELLTPFEWKWKMERRPKDLEDLRRAVSIGQDDLDAALGILIGWVGEAKFTEGSKVDAKSIEISELAFLDLSNIAEMLQERQSSAGDIPPPSFQAHRLEMEQCLGARWFDWNVDTRSELLVWTERELRLGQVDDAWRWKELLSKDLPSPITGLLPVDLFAVDAHRGATPPEVIDPNDRESQITASMRHETIRDLVVYGPAGISILQFLPSQDDRPQWDWLAEDCGLSDLSNVTSMMPIDWESDGDLDLAIVADGKLALRENTGNRRFRDVNQVSLLPPESLRVMALAVVDYDRDVDLDIVLSLQDRMGVMENIQHGQFRFRELGDGWNGLAGSRSLTFGDFDNNYSWDWAGAELLATHTKPGQGVTTTLHQKLGSEESNLVACDWNNDAKLDLIEAHRQGVRLWLNEGGWTFQSIPLATFASEPATNTTISAGDPNRDGWLDIALIDNGIPVVLVPDPMPQNHSLAYRVKGISDENGGGRNNQYAVGSTVEIFGPFGYQARVIDDDAVHFGLGPDRAYSLRLTFVNGLTQGIIDPENNAILEEKQVLIGSCPFLYGWNGESWQLVTDLLWNAPLGLQVARGKVLPDRRWEYLMIPGQAMQPYKNAYELRITEELWETAYFDHVALMAVDHPTRLEVHSNEKVGPPSIAEPALWVFEQVVAPKSLMDSHGRDWTREGADIDGRYAIPFERVRKQGLAEISYLELDFGKIDSQRPAQLVLTGWIYPTDTSLNIGIDQNPELEPPMPPRLLTVGRDGEFDEAIPFTGFPGGKPKTIVVPLDVPFETDDHRIRIEHSSVIYWDRIGLGYGRSVPIPRPHDSPEPLELDPGVRVQWLPMIASDLHYRGFSREQKRRWFEPHWYDYHSLTTTPFWPPLGGRWTRYGSTDEMLRRDDDHLVVMGAGDELIVRFGLPRSKLPEGWSRDLILHSVGWDKDAALNTLEGQSSLPLPSSKYQQYPPGWEDRDEQRRIERIHRESLTREQLGDLFWKPETR